MPVQNRTLCKLSILLEVSIKSWILHSAKFWPLRFKFRKLHFTGFIFSWDFIIITNTCVDKFDIYFIGWQEQQLGKIDNLICDFTHIIKVRVQRYKPYKLRPLWQALWQFLGLSCIRFTKKGRPDNVHNSGINRIHIALRARSNAHWFQIVSFFMNKLLGKSIQ